MTRMAGPDCAVTCNLINTHTHTHIHVRTQWGGKLWLGVRAFLAKNTLTKNNPRVGYMQKSITQVDYRAGLRGHVQFDKIHTHEWHRMTRMTGPDCAVMCNLINTHTHTGAQGTLSLSKNCTSRESVSPLSRLIRGFRNKYH